MAFDYSLYVDIVNKRLVAGFASNTDAPEQVFSRTNQPTLQIQFLQPVGVASIFGNIAQPFTYVDYSASTVALAVGDVKARPASGTFTLTYGANTTPSLAYDITPAALAIALNLLASIISAGGVTAAGIDGGAWEITFNAVGVRTAFTGTPDGLYPASSVVINPAQTGDATHKDIQRLFLYRQPPAFLDSFSPLPAADISVTVLQSGGGGANEVQLVTLLNTPYAGTFSLSFGGYTTDPIAFDATAADVQTALQALTSIGTDNCTVTGDGGPWTVTFVGALANTNVATMTYNASGLSVPLGFSGTLLMDTVGIEELLGTNSQVETTLQIDVTPPGGAPNTLILQACTVQDVVIDGSATVPTPTASYYTQAAANAAFVRNRDTLTGFTGGAGYVDGIATLAATNGELNAGIVSGVLYLWKVTYGIWPGGSAPQFIEPTDYNASTNQKYFTLVARFDIGSVTAYDSSTSFSAAGNSDLVRGGNVTTHKVTVSAGSGTYTHSLSLLTTGSVTGDLTFIELVLPASVNPTVTIYNASTGGTLLKTIVSIPATRTLGFCFVFNGTAWEEIPIQKDLLAIIQGAASATAEYQETALASGINTKAVTFAVAKSSASLHFRALYFKNVTDSPPSIIGSPMIVTQGTGGFTAVWGANTDTANFVLVSDVIINAY